MAFVEEDGGLGGLGGGGGGVVICLEGRLLEVWGVTCSLHDGGRGWFFVRTRGLGLGLVGV